MNGESWKFSKVVSIPSVLSTVGLIVIMVIYVTEIEADDSFGAIRVNRYE